MALVRDEYCRTCETEKMHINGRCRDCSERERREALAAWQAKTTDEKLLDLHKRMLKVESGPPRY